jgi:hypothetical protein
MDKQTPAPAQLAAYIDHTLLKADATARTLKNFAPRRAKTIFTAFASMAHGSGKPAIFWKAPASRLPTWWAFRWAPCPAML